MTVSNEVRVYDHSNGIVIIINKNNADFTTDQFAAIKDKAVQLKNEVLKILDQPATPNSDSEPSEQLWGYGPPT